MKGDSFDRLMTWLTWMLVTALVLMFGAILFVISFWPTGCNGDPMLKLQAGPEFRGPYIQVSGKTGDLTIYDKDGEIAKIEAGSGNFIFWANEEFGEPGQKRFIPDNKTANRLSYALFAIKAGGLK